MTRKIIKSINLGTKTSLALITLLISFASYITIDAQKDADYKKRRDNPYFVTTIIDGDTFAIKNGTRIRLMGTNAPENGLCGSEQAKKLLMSLITDKVVRLEDKSVDRYDRVVASVFVNDGKRDLYVNEIILGKGWARNESSIDVPNNIRLKDAHKLAFDKKLGIYSSLCRLEKSNRSNCYIKGNINAAGNKNYHYPGCDQYNEVIVELDRDEGWYCTEQEAINAGYIKSSVCRKPYTIKR